MKREHLTRLLVVSIAAATLASCGATPEQEAPPPPRVDVTTERAEISNTEIGSVRAGQVILTGTAVLNMEAESVVMTNAAAQAVTATQVTASQSGLGLVSAETVQATESGLGVVSATHVLMGPNTGASFVRAETVTVQSNSAVAFLIADKVEGDVQPAITTEGAIAIGIATGATVVGLILIIHALTQQ